MSQCIRQTSTYTTKSYINSNILVISLFIYLFIVVSALLSFHLLDSIQCSEGILAGTSYETLEGNNIEIGCDGESLTVNGIKMVRQKDIVTTNGVIHIIDKALVPDSG